MRNLITSFFLSLSLLTVSQVQAAPLMDVTRNEIVLSFPETASFQLAITHEVDITSVVLEYGNEQQTCGEVIAKAFPQFTPGKTVNAEWTWEMRQSGSLPPGAQLWWRWRVTDINGNETVTDTKTVTWLDDVHPWQTITSGQLSLHFYGIDKAFAQKMLNMGIEGLNRNKHDAGLSTDSPINIYAYPDFADLQDAMLYEPSWVGGRAFLGYDIIVIGIPRPDLEWGRDVIVHELTHILVGHLTFSCLGDVPLWLHEGLAGYSEGELDDYSEEQFLEAIRSDSLLSVRSISGRFSELPDKATLSYSQSYSLTKFLIERYGQDKMTDLLVGLRDGSTIDDALIQTYGFNLDGLEAAWRQAIGAKPRAVSSQPTAQSTPTFVPTIVPISGGSLALQATLTPVPTSSLSGQSTETPSTRTGPPLSLTLILLGLCCALILVIGLVVLGLVVRNQNSKRGNSV
jgi:hypothetical protein